MDLLDLFEKTEEWLEIKTGDGKTSFIGADGEPFRILIAGPAHPRAFRAEELVRHRVLREMSGEGRGEVTPDQYIERALEPLIIRTLDWSPIMSNGAIFPCTPENVKYLYRNSDLVRKQVEGFVFRAENFQKKPALN